MSKEIKKPKWWDEFLTFAVKGNAMALAVGTIIGAAFSGITKSLTDDIIMPIVAIFMGGIDFSELKITLPRLFGEPVVDEAGNLWNTVLINQRTQNFIFGFRLRRKSHFALLKAHLNPRIEHLQLFLQVHGLH